MSLLEMRNLRAAYGPAQALFDVSLSIDEGEVVALMGRNGMGKSTTVKAICRMIPSQGTLRFAGHDIAPLASHRAARLGIGLVPEGRRCFAPLTVYENLIAAARPGAWALPEIYALFPRLEERHSQIASTLSGGEQQMLAIGRALMTNPRLLILDEATEGLAPLIRAEIWAALSQLRTRSDMAILVIDKSLAELRMVAQRAVILERGSDVWTGTISALDGTIADRYLGV